MKFVFSLPIVLITLLIFSTALTAQDKKQRTLSEAIPSETHQKVIINKDFTPPRDNGRFDVAGIEISGDLLKINISYSGGCKDHTFNLHCDGKYIKTSPPQIYLFLEHLDQGDLCRQLIEEQLIFDISDIKYQGSNQLIIRLNNTTETVTYTYRSAATVR